MTENAIDTMLLVVDMQNGFLGEKSRHVIPGVLQMVRLCSTRGIPIVFSRFHNEPNSPYESLIGWKRLRSPEEVALAEELQPFARTIIEKSSYTSFTQEFLQLVEAQQVKTLIICGVATDGCVLKTAVDAFEKGLRPIVIEDACASHAGEEIHRAGLLLLRRFIGQKQIMSIEEAQRSLSAFQDNAQSNITL